MFVSLFFVMFATPSEYDMTGTNNIYVWGLAILRGPSRRFVPLSFRRTKYPHVKWYH